MSNFLPPFNFQKWINENREKLKPPVNAVLVFEESQFIIMVVGKKDFRHIFLIQSNIN